MVWVCVCVFFGVVADCVWLGLVCGGLQEDDEMGEDTVREGRLKARDGDEMEVEEEGDGQRLSVQEIDAFWLQRQLSKYYEDANLSAKLADDVMAILGMADELECESKLVVLLDVDKFDLIKRLVRNRAKVRGRHSGTGDERKRTQ